VADEVLPGLVAGADAVVMVGLHEGFGLPALEALASGRPVVASRSGALPEVVGPLSASCDPWDEGSIKEALDRALTDEALLRRARLDGPAWAARFSWESTADSLFQLGLKCAVSGEETLAATGVRSLLPRARVRDVLRGRAKVVGSRLDPEAPRGLVSPVESRIHLGIPYSDPVAEEARLILSRSARGDAGHVVRALFTAALAPKGTAVPARSPKIVSAQVDNVTIEEAIEAIFERSDAQGRSIEGRGAARARMVHFVHPHALNLAAFDAELARAFEDADVVLPDGIGIRIAASILGVAMRHNLNGTDLLPLLCERAAAEGVQVALVGAAHGVAEACAARLREATPGLSIPLVSHGFLDEKASHEVASRLRALGRCIVLVGMGSPLQERWAWEYLRDVPEATALTVGGLFDFFSGRMPRAPLGVRELGLEWAFRLAQEPRRMAKRYLIGNPLFLLLALRQRALGPAAITA